MKDKSQIKIIAIICLIVILLTANIYLVIKQMSPVEQKDCHLCINEIKKDPKIKYQNNKKYYEIINYKKFLKLYKKDAISMIAIIDNSSSTYDKFKEYINKLSFYEEKNIYVLEKSKLSKKNQISFYGLNNEFSKLDYEYIITVKNQKILSTLKYNSEELNSLIELYK